MQRIDSLPLGDIASCPARPTPGDRPANFPPLMEPAERGVIAAEVMALETATRDRRDRYRARRRQRAARRWWLAVGLLTSLIASAIYLNGKRAPALAEAPGSTALKQYAESLVGIEPLRQAAYTEVQRLYGSQPVPLVVCSQPDTVRPLSREAKAIVVDYCNQAKAMIEGAGLTVGLFNQISQTHLIDPIVKQRIQDELSHLQDPR